MTALQQRARVVILVKAVPHPSKAHGETVCCAGVTLDRGWKRLFPIPFRRLEGEAQFKRWQWVAFGYRCPTSDRRPESCHVFEDTIEAEDQMPVGERASFLEPLIVSSCASAARRGQSLALVRPQAYRFSWRAKSQVEIDEERVAYAQAVQQLSMVDRPLKALEPTPYEFRITYTDADGAKHDHGCEDWETSATFWKFTREKGEQAALAHLSETYNERYRERGVAFAMGTMASRPRTWLLLGVIRLDEPKQRGLAL